jgi:hypothetical protein
MAEPAFVFRKQERGLRSVVARFSLVGPGVFDIAVAYQLRPRRLSIPEIVPRNRLAAVFAEGEKICPRCALQQLQDCHFGAKRIKNFTFKQQTDCLSRASR